MQSTSLASRNVTQHPEEHNLTPTKKQSFASGASAGSKQQQQRQLLSTTNNTILKRPESLAVEINPTWPAFYQQLGEKTTLSVTWHLRHKDRGPSPSRHTSTALTAFLRGHSSRKLDKMLNSYAGLDVCSFPEVSCLSQVIPKWLLRDKNWLQSVFSVIFNPLLRYIFLTSSSAWREITCEFKFQRPQNCFSMKNTIQFLSRQITRWPG